MELPISPTPPGVGGIGQGEGGTVIELRKMNNERFLLNHNQIECIELIPESKIVMMNHDYYIVRDTVEEIIEKIAKYNAKVQDIHREIAVVERYKE